MASPFRCDKKKRRRFRKFVAAMLSEAVEIEAGNPQINPQIAESFREIAETSARIGQAKRKKRSTNIQPNT